MNDSAAARRVLRAALATDLVAFLERAFRALEQDKTLLLHPYVEFLCAELMRVAAGGERRLILNLPPRHLKSILVSVVFPAFLLGRDPRLRIAVVSHSQDFAQIGSAVPPDGFVGLVSGGFSGDEAAPEQRHRLRND